MNADMERATIDKICKDCGAVFTLTEADQQFFEGRGLKSPRRCKPCRALRRQEKAEMKEWR
jgi:hypothetical protein